MKIFLNCLLVISFLVGCSSNQTEKPEKEEKVKVIENKETDKKVKNEDKEEAKTKESSINTSVFKYAKNVEVTDARDITKHITVTVFMSEEIGEGLAAQHVLNQTYDFIQQKDIKGANTLTIGVMVGDKRVFQYSIDTAKFVPKENEPMADVVLAASKVEKISPEVEEFATTFEWKMNK